MTTVFNFTITSEDLFPNKKCNVDRFIKEIQESNITIAFESVVINNNDVVVTFKSSISSEEETILSDLVKIHNGTPLIPFVQDVNFVGPQTPDGKKIFAIEKSSGASKSTFVTPDWTDPTTWVMQSIRIIDEIATDYGDHTTYSLSHQNIIDTYHAKLWQEDFLKDNAGNSFRTVVKVNNVVKSEQDPHIGSGGDFIFNYTDGTLTFLTQKNENDIVKVTYHYANGSKWILAPFSGKQIKIERVECQFSDDWEMLDSVVFQPYGFVDIFAPQYLKANGGPYDPGTKIPLGNPLIYKSANDFQNEANLSYPVYPIIGGSGWRGSGRPCMILNWDYISSTLLRSDYGMEVHIFLQHDIKFGGHFATATLYCVSEDI